MPERFLVPDGVDAPWPDLVPDGLVAAVGDARTVALMNARAEQITGLCAEDVLGRDLLQALPLQDLGGESWWALTNPWAGLATRTGHRERLLVLPSGRELLVTARYNRSVRGGPVESVVLALRDAEGRRRAEAESAALLTAVAHELRSPLTGVKGFSSTLLRNWERFTDDQKRLMLETIEADAGRVTRLITELLDTSRIGAGRLTVHAQPLPVRPCLETEVERRVAAGTPREQFEVEVEDGVEVVWADPDRLAQVVTNLVDNALRHGRGLVRLTAQRSRWGGPPAVDLVVADDGDGIAPQHRELVFSRFWQGGAKHGTGLGLYLVRGLVAAHGGRVVVEDAAGGGALLRATFPDLDAPEAL
ncbi:HAMP domain-containing histidine kinase [Phycicoccus endophyticus]|uniref:histidine kinase n=1 Tax=Phycicoccus endophyticus TaxID=1690220 RepID=A0A7G9R437_9MICO|nr:HAMP domain-containing sensor histidine kinase [Phycicoccus endophyticus]NHI18205.1 HAMP domain-containing histidine kinase [Phycicoccus endophyticus]QNN50362.1 HAMP domain-containing histidine kinase [Phycicoccus endophyticus]GGL25656.1 PAS domain-containing sensor histidine kinase [Phycicoccus endophyticus]